MEDEIDDVVGKDELAALKGNPIHLNKKDRRKK